MKKFLLAVFSVILIACVSLAVACTTGDYHKVTFRQANGVSYVSNVQDGSFGYGVWEVKNGETVTFSLKLSADATGEPVVYANSKVLEANPKGKYSVKVTGDVDIRVDGIDAAGEYNRLLMAATHGVSYEILTEVDGMALQNGMMVKKGTEVRFQISIADGFYGTPTVKQNGTELTANGGVYSFIMNSPTTVTVEGIMKNVEYTFNVNGGNTRVKYVDGQGHYFPTDVPLEGKFGDKIKFKVEVSVYYVQSGYEVQANNEILSPDNEGYYTVTLQSDSTTVNVAKLVQDTPYTSRPDGGSGSLRDPYRLSRPIDLYQMAMLINSEFYTQEIYRVGYYVLENDIDLKGEQLYVIGDGSTGYAYFAGSFDGQNHTISNYYIEDSRVEQEEYATIYLTNVGMFGYVVPMNNRAASISNLKLDHFTITANSSRTNVSQEYTLSVGALAGATFGASISNVSATGGVINVTGGQQSGAYVGGLVGQQMSYLLDIESFGLNSALTSCMADVNINVVGGFNYVYATGGVVGVVASNSPEYTAYVLNCYATGNIEGGQHAGGVVGYVAQHAAVINCYATGEVRAVSPFAKNDIYYESVYYANAGGIAGYAGYNTVIANSFSTGYISAQSARTDGNYKRISGTVGYVEDALPGFGMVAPMLLNVHGQEGLTIDAKAQLHWSENDWSFSGSLPTLKGAGTKGSVQISFEVDAGFGGSVGNKTLSGYNSMAGWYKSRSLAEFVNGGSGNRSYGYFFDSLKTQKVPSSFVPTYDITLYVGYADYSTVSGVYYLGDSVSDNAIIELDTDGNFLYRNGALIHLSYYTWDGETIVLYNTSLGELTKLDLPEELYTEYFGTYYTFAATYSNGAITITGGTVQEIAITEDGAIGDYTGETFELFTSEQPLNGLKAIEDFNYGSYYNGNDKYTFNGNGSGIWTSGNNETPFTYYVSGAGELTLSYNQTTVTATYSGGYVTAINSASVQPYDGFTGKWERAYSSDGVYSFDGKGGWTYTVGQSTNSGTYSVLSGVLTANGNAFTAELIDGVLKVTAGSKVVSYYKEGSFVGEWTFSGKNINKYETTISLILYGIGEDGYGEAHIEYASGTTFDLTYEAVVNGNDKSIMLFDGPTLYGALDYDKANLSLNGIFYDSIARFTVIDGIAGMWISDNETIKSANFNGSGFYDLESLASGANRVKGTVRINDTSRTEYTFDRATLSGSFTYKSVVYTIQYDEASNLIRVNGGSFSLTTRDKWYSVQLVDEDGYVYSFDGMGGLENGGKLNVSNDSYFAYKLQGDEIILTGNNTTDYKNGTITLGADGTGKPAYVLNYSDSTKTYLYLYTPFTGDWVIGSAKGTISIGEVYVDNTASGTYTAYGQSAHTVDFTYNREGNYLTFIDGSTQYYLIAMVSGDVAELSFGTSASIYGSDNVVCVLEEKTDKMYGKVFTTGEGYKLIFDGLAYSKFGNGSVVVLNTDGSVEATYTYEYNSYGYPTVILDHFWEYVFVECESNTKFDVDVLYSLTDGAGKYYAIVSTDGLYTLVIADGDNRDVYYEFDGAGKVTRTEIVVDGDDIITVYSYRIVKIDSEHYKHTLEFTDSEGIVYTVTLDLSSKEQVDWNLTFNRA